MPEPISPERVRALQIAEVALERAYRIIERAATAGEDVTHWQEVWLRLLNEYDRSYDALLAEQSQAVTHAE